ncbi:MAG: hypothetical protein SGPRY_004007, partial [Prymnesium sp.]
WSNEEMDALLDQFPAGVRLLGAPLVQPTPSGKVYELLMRDEAFSSINEPIPSAASKTGFKGVYKARNGRFQAQCDHRAIGGFATAREAGIAVARMEAWRRQNQPIGTGIGDRIATGPSASSGSMMRNTACQSPGTLPANAGAAGSNVCGGEPSDPANVVDGWFSSETEDNIDDHSSTSNMVSSHETPTESENDEMMVNDTATICQLLAERFHQHPLAPADVPQTASETELQQSPSDK